MAVTHIKSNWDGHSTMTKEVIIVVVIILAAVFLIAKFLPPSTSSTSPAIISYGCAQLSDFKFENDMLTKISTSESCSVTKTAVSQNNTVNHLFSDNELKNRVDYLQLQYILNPTQCNFTFQTGRVVASSGTSVYSCTGSIGG